jgi:hypothetical protein
MPHDDKNATLIERLELLSKRLNGDEAATVLDAGIVLLRLQEELNTVRQSSKEQVTNLHAALGAALSAERAIFSADQLLQLAEDLDDIAILNPQNILDLLRAKAAKIRKHIANAPRSATRRSFCVNCMCPACVSLSQPEHRDA